MPRHGTEHQAGSDSLLTADVFFALRSQFFDGHLDDAKYLGQIHGLGSSSSNARGAPGDRSSGGVVVADTSGSIADDALALSSDPLPSLSHQHHHHHQAPGSAGRRYPNIGTPVPPGSSTGAGSGPRASSAVSIKNPNAVFTPAVAAEDRQASPAVR